MPKMRKHTLHKNKTQPQQTTLQIQNLQIPITQTTNKNTTKHAFTLYPYIIRLSMHTISRMLKIQPSTILYWIKNFAPKTYQKPTPQREVVIELDEMWHFLRSKKQGLGVEGVLSNYQRAGGLGMWKPKCPNTKTDA
jgi:hypothetical protein